MKRLLQLGKAITEVITPISVVVACFAAFGLAAGFLLDWVELTVLGIGALVCLVICGLFLLGRHNVDVEVKLPRNRVVVGDTASAALIVTNRRSRMVMPSRIELPVGANTTEFVIPRLSPGAHFEESLTIPTDRRGVYPVGPARSVQGDPIGVFAHEQPWGSATDLFVHPRTIRLDNVTAGLLRDLDGQPVPQLSDSDVAFHALRDYIPGDDRRAVHWKSTARLGRMMVRQHEETRRWHLAIALSTSTNEFANEDEFELAVSVAGTLGLHALAHGRDLTVLTHDRGLRTTSRNTLLDQLAAVNMADTKKSIVELAADVASQAPSATIIALLCGSTVEAATLKAAQSRLPLGVFTIAVSARPGARPESRRMGTLPLLSVGTLAEFPRAMRGVRSVAAQ